MCVCGGRGGGARCQLSQCFEAICACGSAHGATASTGTGHRERRPADKSRRQAHTRPPFITRERETNLHIIRGCKVLNISAPFKLSIRLVKHVEPKLGS